MGWRATVGEIAARVVRLAERVSDGEHRALNARERSVLEGVFEASLDLDVLELCEGVTGLVNLSRRAFVIENTLFVPRSYLPLADATLVHEATHAWQFQNGGYAYIGDSIHAQLLGDGYDLAKGLREGKRWEALNCEQQATLIEWGYARGCFEGRALIIDGVDFTLHFARARDELRAGRGAAARRF